MVSYDVNVYYYLRINLLHHVHIVYHSACLSFEDFLIRPDEDMFDVALHLRQHSFARVVSFLLGSC